MDWLVDSITYALKHRRWEDEDSSIYNDPNGPDKVINRMMRSTRVNLYVYTNRKKRIDSFGMKSLESIAEKTNDNTLELADYDQNVDTGVDIRSYVKELFLKKEYFMAFLIDVIINYDVMSCDDENDTNIFLNTKKAFRLIRSIDEGYCDRFAEEYDIDKETVRSTLKYFV